MDRNANLVFWVTPLSMEFIDEICTTRGCGCRYFGSRTVGLHWFRGFVWGTVF